MDVFRVLQDFGVTRPYAMLRRLALIYDIAWENAKRGRDQDG